MADASLVKHTNNETLLTAISADGDAVQTLLTQLDTVQDNALTKLTNVETLITTLDGVQDNALTKLTNVETLITQLDVVADASLVKHTNNETLLTAISADGDAVQTLLTQLDVVADASLVKHTNNETLLTAMSAKLPASLGGKSVANSISTCRDSDAGSYDMTARTTIGNASTTTALLCDSGGRLQVDVISGGGSTDVSGVATHAKQDTIIGHLDGVEGKLDIIETSADAILAKNTQIETLITQLDVVADASLVKHTNNETLLTAISADGDAVQTLLSTMDGVLDAIKIDTESIETAVELIDDAIYTDDAGITLGSSKGVGIMGFAGTQSVNDNDAGFLAMTNGGFLKQVNPMTTTQVDDGKSISAGGSSTSSVLNLTHMPTGRITFVIDPAVISVGDIQIDSVQFSFDGTLYLTLYSEFLSSRDGTGHKIVQIKDFVAPYFKIAMTNTSGGSNETNMDIWAVY